MSSGRQSLPALDAIKPTFFATPAAFRRWLEQHHTTADELWVGFHKRATGTPSITWPESVDQALCFGWIDAVRKSLGDASYVIRFCPRRPTSIWSANNIARVKELTAAGLMTAAGTRAFEARSEKRSRVYSYERSEPAKLPPAFMRQLRADKAAWTFFGKQAPWYQRVAVHWVISAKQEATRARRFATLLACSAAGRTVPPLTRPG
jgi:uncharacterized protein YdeI (YjbR/CyaY-like superfamily)